MAGDSSLRSVLVTGDFDRHWRGTVRALADQGFEVFAGCETRTTRKALCEQSPSRIATLQLDVTERRIDSCSGAMRPGEIGWPWPVRAREQRRHRIGRANGMHADFRPAPTIRGERDRSGGDDPGLLAATAQAAGRIVNISSISGRVALPFVGPYAASKFALRAMSDSPARSCGHGGSKS